MAGGEGWHMSGEMLVLLSHEQEHASQVPPTSLWVIHRLILANAFLFLCLGGTPVFV